MYCAYIIICDARLISSLFSHMYTVYVYDFFVFFFKQKTAYEMRISDWSSDVCSSDLEAWIGLQLDKGARFTDWSRRPLDKRQIDYAVGDVTHLAKIFPMMLDKRSEEHTSELQSLMRISYDVFCLKKKTTIIEK